MAETYYSQFFDPTFVGLLQAWASLREIICDLFAQIPGAYEVDVNVYGLGPDHKTYGVMFYCRGVYFQFSGYYSALPNTIHVILSRDATYIDNYGQVRTYVAAPADVNSPLPYTQWMPLGSYHTFTCTATDKHRLVMVIEDDNNFSLSGFGKIRNKDACQDWQVTSYVDVYVPPSPVLAKDVQLRARGRRESAVRR